MHIYPDYLYLPTPEDVQLNTVAWLSWERIQLGFPHALPHFWGPLKVCYGLRPPLRECLCGNGRAHECKCVRVVTKWVTKVKRTTNLVEGRRRAIRRTRIEETAGHMLQDELLLQLILVQTVVALPVQLVVATRLVPPLLALFAPLLLLLLQLQSQLVVLLSPTLHSAEAGITVELVALEAGQRGIATPACGAIGSAPPVRQLDSESPALVGVRRKAVAVTVARWTLTHVHPAGGLVVLRIQSLVALAEERGNTQWVAVEVRFALVAGGRGSQEFTLAGTGLGATHLPGIGKVPDLVVPVAPSILPREIVPRTAVEVAT